jgi:hypothetical protein
VGGEIGRDDSDQAVGVAEEIGQGCIEVCDCFRAYDGGEDKHLEAQANSGRVDDGTVATSGAAGFQVTDPSLTAGDAEADPVGELGECDSPVRLQVSKNFAIYAVHIQAFDSCRGAAPVRPGTSAQESCRPPDAGIMAKNWLAPSLTGRSRSGPEAGDIVSA